MDDDQLLMPVSSVVQPSHTPWYLFIGDFFNILKAFIGTNYQALPFAFKNSGLIVGIVGVAIIAALTDYCCNLLIYCKYIVIDNAIEEERSKGILDDDGLREMRQKLSKSVGYGDIGRRAFGEWGNFVYHLIQIAVWITQYLTLAAYFIFIGNTIMELFPMTPALIPLTNATYPPLPKPNMAEGVPFLAIHNIGKRIRRSADDNFDSPNLFQDGNGLSGWDSMFSYARNETNYVQEDLGDQDSIFESVSKNVTEMPLDFNTTTAAMINTTTAMPTTTQASNITNATTTAVPTPDIYYVPTAWDLRLLCLLPLGFFLATSMIRYVRQIGFFSVIASVALAMGAIAVFSYMCIDFEISTHGFEYAKLMTLPLFVGQLISAYEGIGCIVPIESSMDGHPKTFKNMLHANVLIVCVILISFGSIGYMKYGDDVAQLIVLKIPQHTMLSILIDVTLIISVLFTYPIQAFPVIEITENYLFAPGSCSNPAAANDHTYREINEPINADNAMERSTTSIEESVKSIAVHVPDEVPAWKRNIVRVILTLSVCGVGILARNAYAYLAAFSGAIGCSLLAYILPCVIHLRLRSRIESLGYVILHVVIICLAVLASVFTLVVIIMKMVKGEKDL